MIKKPKDVSTWLWKRELERELEEVKKQEEYENKKEEREKQFNIWTRRDSYPLIGKAHSQMYSEPSEVVFEFRVFTNNKIGELYKNEVARFKLDNHVVREATNIQQFVWTNFFDKMEELFKDIEKTLEQDPILIINNLAIHYNETLFKDFPEDKRQIVKKELEKEHDRILSRFSIEQLRELKKGLNFDGEGVLNNYLNRHDKRLITK